MIERRAEPRLCLPDVTGRILIDEHRTVLCIVSDRSPSGIKITLPSTDDVPDAFILTVDGTGETLVCRAAWRKDDQIGCIADALVTEWRPRPTLRRQPVLA
ncbi:PilZ domain-containing protein [Methylobacterium sp. J-048]|uniref:PilZ domain-containing protein n=1 Tax=Methylobacterium sp. J-048 TaxID=2836635 RepID=UPI001FB89FF3|nr:PilZ domain-containing protein [Methylobacterium sp. J-048]MCJ2055514.1 PilZ domain-containing protein [Methylobacterium sp. J-048]